jgi:AcrR family transcriptional regulator
MSEELTLREYKYAKTRADIWDAFLELVNEKDFEKISINEVCEKAHVSRGTFFNYFPSKEHLYTYYGWCFCADLYICLNESPSKNLSCKEKIKFIFNYTATENKKTSDQFSKFVIHILRRPLNIINEIKFTKVDFLYRYPSYNHCFSDSAEMALPTVGEHFFQIVQEGIERKEFRSDISVKGTVYKILAIYFSPPVISKFLRQELTLQDVYEETIDDLLEAIISKH